MPPGSANVLPYNMRLWQTFFCHCRSWEVNPRTPSFCYRGVLLRKGFSKNGNNILTKKQPSRVFIPLSYSESIGFWLMKVVFADFPGGPNKVHEEAWPWHFENSHQLSSVGSVVQCHLQVHLSLALFDMPSPYEQAPINFNCRQCDNLHSQPRRHASTIRSRRSTSCWNILSKWTI